MIDPDKLDGRGVWRPASPNCQSLKGIGVINKGTGINAARWMYCCSPCSLD